jgi:hypothetical protein
LLLQDPKNGNLTVLYGRLIGTPTTSQGVPFKLNNAFFVDGSIFITDNIKELKTLAPILVQHFKRLGMQMHVGTKNTKSKTEAMCFSKTLTEARILNKIDSVLPPNIPLPDKQHIQFTKSFKYLGSILSPKLNEDVEVKAWIRKAKALIGATKLFFSNRDVDLRMKHNIYNSFAINATLWGCKSWNLSVKNKNQLEAFHHSSIRKILNIKWQQG